MFCNQTVNLFEERASEMERLSRRGFVQAAGAAGVGRLLASRDQQSPAPPKGPKEEGETGAVRKLPAGVEGRGIWTYYGSKKKPLSEKVIASGIPVKYALEVPRGFFERHGIEEGDTVVVPEEVKRVKIE